MSRTPPVGFCHQSTPNTCVAACVSMVLQARGFTVTEQDLVTLWGPPPGYGYLTTRAGRCVLQIQPPSSPVDAAQTFARLVRMVSDGWLIAEMFTGPMTVFARELEPPANSPYGPLCKLYSDRDSLWSHGWPPHHAVVVISGSHRSVRLLDPWFRASDQPLTMSREDFLRACAGAIRRPDDLVEIGVTGS